MAQRVLVVDVGGTHLKILASGQETPRKVASGSKMTPQLMCNWVRKAASDWRYEVAAIGYPGPVVHGRPVHEPYNMSKGWVGFDYAKGLGCPVKVINDAAMQAIGSYQGGRMLFLGLGTGLGSAMIVDGIVEPMELAHLPYKNGKNCAYATTHGPTTLVRSRPFKEQPCKKEASFALRVAKDPMFGSTAGERLIRGERESTGESLSGRSIPSKMNRQH